ncbi:MAG: hypothetical protein HW387_1703, partial [Parachlamydiales bacterium]|nr:hypothetical protein [Parachlamydiales bacterium]
MHVRKPLDNIVEETILSESGLRLLPEKS